MVQHWPDLCAHHLQSFSQVNSNDNNVKNDLVLSAIWWIHAESSKCLGGPWKQISPYTCASDRFVLIGLETGTRQKGKTKAGRFKIFCCQSRDGYRERRNTIVQKHWGRKARNNTRPNTEAPGISYLKDRLRSWVSIFDVRRPVKIGDREIPRCVEKDSRRKNLTRRTRVLRATKTRQDGNAYSEQCNR